MKPNEYLKKLRKLSGLTQAKAAEIIETSRSNYTHKENGKSPFTINEVLALLFELRKKVEGKEFSYWLSEFLGVEDHYLSKLIQEKSFPELLTFWDLPTIKKTKEGNKLEYSDAHSTGILIQDHFSALVDLLIANDDSLSQTQKKSIGEVLSKLEYLLFPQDYVEKTKYQSFSEPTALDPAYEILNEVLQERGEEITPAKAREYANALKRLIADEQSGKSGYEIKKFEDEEEGLEANRNLLILEQNDPDLFYEMTSQIRAKAKALIVKQRKA